MTAKSNTCNETQLSDEELNLVVGGRSPVVVGPERLVSLTLANPPSVNVSAVQPIHLAPLPPLHVAVPHF